MKHILLTIALISSMATAGEPNVTQPDVALSEAIANLHHERQTRWWLDHAAKASAIGLISTMPGLPILSQFGPERVKQLLRHLGEHPPTVFAVMASVPVGMGLMWANESYAKPEKSARLAQKYFKQMNRFMDQDPKWQYRVASENPDLRNFLVDLDQWFRVNYERLGDAPQPSRQNFIKFAP